jgi:hypothetical protein
MRPAPNLLSVLGAGNRLDVDFLALLAHRAAATRVMSAPAQGAAVESVLELLAVLASDFVVETVILPIVVSTRVGTLDWLEPSPPSRY